MKKKILIVDDDPRNIFALRANLKRAYDCISCNDAIEAIKLLEGEEKVDVVLMDMMMPDMDGYEAIPLIKKLPNRMDTPVIAVTAQAMVGDREKCIRAGADDYVSKPVDLDKLLLILSRY